MISTVLDERRLPSLRGQLAIAHCRYSTTGSTIWENAQPTYRLGPRRALAIGHNGNLVNTRELLEPARGRPAAPAGLDRHGAADRAPRRRAGRGHGRRPAPGPAARPRRVQPRRPRRAPRHRRPRSVRLPAARPGPPARGRRERRRHDGLWGDDDAAAGWCLSSETAALDIVGAEYVRDVEPGEIVILEPGQAPRSVRFAERDPRAVRLRAHLLRPARLVHGGPQPVRGPSPDGHAARRASTRSRPTSSCPFPTPGAPAAAGYAEVSGLPYREGMYRNRYAGRTFIQPSPGLRHRGVTIKLNPLREVVRGKRLMVVDDSIVRGTTTKQIVELLRKAGADGGPRPDQRAADLPPVLLRHRHADRDRAHRVDPHASPRSSEFIGADSLGYLSIRGVLAALDLPYDRFCFACFDGHYPDPVPYDAEPQVHARGACRGRGSPGRGPTGRRVPRRRRGRRGRRPGGGADARSRRVDPPARGRRRSGWLRWRLYDPDRLATRSR